METVQSVLSILMMIGIGVFVAWKLGFDEKNSAGLASLVINITLPAYMISNISLNYTTESLLAIAPGLAVPFAALGICYVLGKVTARLIGVHIVGHSASELVHIGQAYLKMQATAPEIAESLYNYPTLSDMYRHAALTADLAAERHLGVVIEMSTAD